MIYKLTATSLKFGILAFLFVGLLFADGVWGFSSNHIGSGLREVAAVLRDPETQWMVFLGLGGYFVTLLFLRTRLTAVFWRRTDPNPWLAYALLASAVLYTIDYSASTQALTLLAGAVLGQGAVVWADFESRNQQSAIRKNTGKLILSLLVLLLALASVWNVNSSHSFEYRLHLRWSGPWDNPNVFGLLMGTGLALAAGGAVSCVVCQVPGNAEVRSCKLEIRKYAVAILCFFAAMLMVRGLLYSYSRGAWLATICGLVFLAFRTVKDSHCQPIRAAHWIRVNKVSLIIIACAIAVLAFFWLFQEVEHPVVMRASSVGNVNDFSWRNRIVAWEGDLQMMAEKPWFGYGWNQPELLYEYYYLPPKSTDSTAIQMNDYLIFGATLGIPALFCFGMYLWLSLQQNRESRIGNPELMQAKWLQTVCRAGAIVLLVGFWFDGGLFKLATASVFWILLELGRADLIQQKATKKTEMHPLVA